MPLAAGADVARLLEPAADHILAGEIRGARVEAAALPPLDDDVVDHATDRVAVIHFDIDRITRETRDRARLRDRIATARHDPIDRRNRRAILQKTNRLAARGGVVRCVTDEALAAPARHANRNLA